MIIPFTNSPANINLSHSIVAKPRVLQDFKPLRYHHPSHKFPEAPHIVNVWVPFYTIKKEHILLALFFTVYNYCNTSNCVPLLSAFLHNHLKYGILHYILYLWCIRVVSNEVGDLSSLSLESLYPLSPHQTAILADITLLFPRANVLFRTTTILPRHSPAGINTCVLLAKPGTGKSQVLIHAISHAIHHEMSVLVAAPVALLAQGYDSIFCEEVTTDTLHDAFSIPIDGPYPNEITYRINHYDFIVVNEASMKNVSKTKRYRKDNQNPGGADRQH